MEQNSTSIETYLSFYVNDNHVLLAVEYVNLVVELPALQSVPDLEPSFAGVLNYHGKNIPVYDLYNLITGDQYIEKNIDTPLVLVDIDSEQFGLLVSKINSLVEIKKENLLEPHTNAKYFVEKYYEEESLSGWVLNIRELLIRHHLH